MSDYNLFLIDGQVNFDEQKDNKNSDNDAILKFT